MFALTVPVARQQVDSDDVAEAEVGGEAFSN